VFSSSVADRDILAAYDGHANGYVRKPDSVEALSEVAETIERFCTTVSFRKSFVRSNTREIVVLTSLGGSHAAFATTAAR
jgi:hypothetical protein